MPNLSTHLEIIHRYLKAIEDGTFSSIEGLFAPGMIIEQFPNRIYPQGVRHDVAQMAVGFEKGRKLLSAQTYEIKNAIVDEDSVAVEVLWTGTLAVSLGTLSVGSQMRANCAMFFKFKEGKIAGQRNYDCFELW